MGVIKENILPFFLRAFIIFLSRTFRWTVYDEIIVNNIKKQSGSVIFCFWHGRQFPLVYSHRNRNISIMTSLSQDGELQTKILEGFGYDLVRGSSSHGGMRAAVQMLKRIEKGLDTAFTVDGPRGPIYKVKPGPIFLAMRTGRPIIPVAASSKRCFHIKKTWDNYMLPKPFTDVAVQYGTPIFVKTKDEIDEKRKELERVLHSLTEELDKKIGKK